MPHVLQLERCIHSFIHLFILEWNNYILFRFSPYVDQLSSSFAPLISTMATRGRHVALTKLQVALWCLHRWPIRSCFLQGVAETPDDISDSEEGRWLTWLSITWIRHYFVHVHFSRVKSDFHQQWCFFHNEDNNTHDPTQHHHIITQCCLLSHCLKESLVAEVRYCALKQSVNLLPFWSLEFGGMAVDITREQSCRANMTQRLYLSWIMITMIVTFQCIALNF